jgi:polyamine oxidase
VHLSTPVTAISTQSDHFEIKTPITTFAADAVIVTVPLGCLQQSTISFSPPLPLHIQSAIHNLGFGNLEKIFLKFERDWWTNEWSSEVPDMFTFLPPSSLPPDAPDQLLNAFSLATLPIHAQPVLAIYTADAWTKYLATKSDAEIADLFENHFLPSLPNFTQACIITDIFRTNWTGDPFAYGSYTHVPTGSEDGIDDLRVLGEKIMELPGGGGGLWFAGEHAGIWDLATVNGAMTSGTMAALDVWRTLEKEYTR